MALAVAIPVIALLVKAISVAETQQWEAQQARVRGCNTLIDAKRLMPRN